MKIEYNEEQRKRFREIWKEFEKSRNEERKNDYDKPNWQLQPCQNVFHNPPMNLYLIPGQTYKHRCNSCGYKIEIRNPIISCYKYDRIYKNR